MKGRVESVLFNAGPHSRKNGSICQELTKGQVSISLHELFPSILTPFLLSTNSTPYFADEKPKAQRDKATCPGMCSWQAAEMRCRPRQSDPNGHTVNHCALLTSHTVGAQ